MKVKLVFEVLIAETLELFQQLWKKSWPTCRQIRNCLMQSLMSCNSWKITRDKPDWRGDMSP